MMKLTRTEFARKMREYSNLSNKTVEHSLWKQLKSLAINSNVINVEIESNAIRFQSRRSGPILYSVKTHPSIASFISFIQGVSMNTSTNTLNAAILDTNDFYKNANRSTLDLSDVTVSPVDNNWGAVTITSDVDYLKTNIDSIRKELDKLTKEDKENKNMNMINFDFGKITSDTVRISMYGIAVKSVDGRYVSYDTKTHSVMDVEIMNMPAGDFLYKMPVAIKDVKAGDVVIHNRVPMFVVDVHESTLKVIDIREGTEKEIYLTKNIFNFNFVTKVVSVMDMMGADMKPSEDQPFGNPAMLMMLMGSEKMDDMLPLMLMNNNIAMNPMMAYMLMGNKDSKMDPMLMFAMMNMDTSK